MINPRRVVTGCISLIFASMALPSSAATIDTRNVAPSQTGNPLYTLSLQGKRSAKVYAGGLAEIFDSTRKTVEYRILQPANLTDKGRLLFELMKEPQRPFIDDQVLVVFRTGVQAEKDVGQIEKPTLVAMRRSVAKHQTISAPSYTNDIATNRALGRIGTDRVERLFRQFSRSALSSMHARAQGLVKAGKMLDFSNAYRLHVTNASVRYAVSELLKLPSVEYASADWRISSMATPPVQLPAAAMRQAQTTSAGQRPLGHSLQSASSIPGNYAITASAQSMLNSPSNNVVAAYDEVQRVFGQLPGQGEIITNVSIGDLDDQSAANNPFDPCAGFTFVFGPTTVVINGQRYIDWPSMPLIPTYAAHADGTLSGTQEVCGADPFLGEVGLDFSMMAPLPHDKQRPSNLGSGFTDLLGIAPGANYRLVVPANPNASMSDIDGAFLGAAAQWPHPDVITASLGFGLDALGFPGRFLEDDPLTESLIAGIVSQYNIVICVSANDGLRLFTTAAVAPSGGSAATNVTPNGTQFTNLNDVALSTVPSEDYDSGSVDVGGTTLDDIFAAQPQNPQFNALASQHAFAETRWTGFTAFSSGFGTRVNVAAPSDNVVAFAHSFNGPANAVAVNLEGGTSASAPEVAAVAAIVRQVGKLTGHPMTALQVRDFLNTTGSPIPDVPQADMKLAMGNAVNAGKAVETLLALAGKRVSPSVPRVAIEQRRDLTQSPGDFDNFLDTVFLTDTNPTAIDLQGPLSSNDGANTGENQNAWISIAPDWEGVPDNATFKLYLTGQPSNVLATTRYARLIPKQILQAAGLPLVSSSTRTVNLTYAAAGAGRIGSTARGRLSTQFSLTFGPADSTTRAVLAPIVPAVVRGTTIPVTYDLTNARNVANPKLVVTEPGRINPRHLGPPQMAYTQSLAVLKGTVDIPVSALQGGGIYGIGIQFGTVTNSVNGKVWPLYSDFAFTRLQPSPASDSRPIAPLLSSSASAPAHYLEIPYGGSFTVAYDVRNISGATGAMLEISAAGPTAWGIYNPFNNPNGTIRDKNGVDTGSLYFVPISGTYGTTTLNGVSANLIPTLQSVVRVIPTANGIPVGEASEVSTITMDGVNPGDGGYLNDGWAINQNGSDGFLTSNQFLANFFPLSSLQAFDQSSSAVTSSIFGEQPGSKISTYGWGIWASDLGLFGFTFGTQAINGLFNPASGAITGLWTPQIPSNFSIFEAAPNSQNTVGLFLAHDQSVDHSHWFRLFTSDLSADTTGSIYDVSAPVQSFQNPVYLGIGQNPSTNTAVLVGQDAANQATPVLVTVNLSNGQLSSFTGISGSSANVLGAAYDPKTNKAAVTTDFDQGLSIYNLATQSGTEVTLPGIPPTNRSFTPGLYHGSYVASDATNGLFAVNQVVAPDVFSNNNSLSQVLFYDEAGNLLKSEERFWFFDVPLPLLQAGTQLNPSQRTGYTFGPFTQQLEPFRY